MLPSRNLSFGKNTRLGIRLAGLLVLALFSQISFAQTASVSNDVELKIGLGGVVRLGHWAPIALIVKNDEMAKRATKLEISCPDDADVPVTWRSTIQPDTVSGGNGEGTVIHGLFRLGRTNGSLDLRLLDSADRTVFAKTVSLTDTTALKVVDGTSRIVLLLGQSDAFRDRIPTNIGENFVIATVRDAAEIPLLYLGLQSASHMIAGGSTGLELNRLQADSVTQWVQQGGHLLLVSRGEEQQEARTMDSLIPGTARGNALLKASRPLEVYVRAREPLEITSDRPLPVHQITPSADASELVKERDYPLVVRGANGFGVVTWTAFALDSELFINWQGTPKAIERLILKPFSEEQSNIRDALANADARHGFVDFSGQLRMALENFGSVRLVNFTSVATISIFAILIFGIGDWFLLRFVFPSRTWTWLTFPLMVFGICLAAWSIQRWARPNEFRINHVEIVDIDQPTGMYRGSAWNCVFIPESTTANLSTRIQADWLRVPGVVTTGWQGQPGSGLGGMQTKTGIGIGGGSYSIANGAGESAFVSQTESIRMDPSSARTFRSQFSGQTDATTSSRLVIDRGRLDGIVVNNLPVRLTRAKVYFGEMVYILQRSLEPGEAVEISEMIARTSGFVLNRLERIDDRNRKDLSVTTPWQVTDIDLSRIANMMMFHSLAGGSSYSGLTNDYYDQLEMSGLISLNRAVLVGETSEPASTLNINANQVSSGSARDAFESMDHSLTILRIVIPVAPGQAPSND